MNRGDRVFNNKKNENIENIHGFSSGYGESKDGGTSKSEKVGTIRKRIFSVLFSFTLIFSILVSTSLLSFANAPEGKGDGTGGGGSIELSMTGIKAEENRVELEFSKNVTNLTVKENNSNSFEIRDAEGNELNFEVEIPDDQLEREKRRDIYLNLSEPLESEKDYILTVKKGFMAKNGEKTENDIVKEFKLGTDEQMEAELKEDVEELEEEEVKEESPSKRYVQNKTLIIVVAILVISFAVMIIRNSRKER